MIQLPNRLERVARLVGEGLSNPEIARSLRLAEGTVEQYVSEALRTVGLGHRGELGAWARQHLLELAAAGFPYVSRETIVKNTLTADLEWRIETRRTIRVAGGQSIDSIRHWNRELRNARLYFSKYSLFGTLVSGPAGVDFDYSHVLTPTETAADSAEIIVQFNPPLTEGMEVSYLLVQEYGGAPVLRADVIAAAERKIANRGRIVASRGFRVAYPTLILKRTYVLPTSYRIANIAARVTMNSVPIVEESERASLAMEVTRARDGATRIESVIEHPRLGAVYHIEWEPLE